jgi:O-acetyl-ADP-ribose deacetylase (regulator of RNase III)
MAEEEGKMKRSPQFRLISVTGNLFTASVSHSLAHCISKDCRLGRGIAKSFRDKFGRVDEIRGQNIGVGGVAILNLGQRSVYNLITKERYFDKPNHDSLGRALRAMRRDALERNIKKIAMPRIGCGLDLLEWEQVRNLLVSVFKDTDIEITIYTLGGDGQSNCRHEDKERKGREKRSE